jgi:hypothetical protein
MSATCLRTGELHQAALGRAFFLRPALCHAVEITVELEDSMPHNPAFNPYAMYPTKAVLKLNGDLDSMTQGWSRSTHSSPPTKCS